MGHITQPKEYWIASGALNITLNTLNNPNRIQASVVSGAVVSCYIDGVDGLGLDNGRNPKRWSLTVSPTYFNSNTAKYVYVAIPRSNNVGTQAVVVFPSELLDIYGINEEGTQVGSIDYYYVWLQAIISATDGTTDRGWSQTINTGSLGTYEDIMDMTETDWYSYSKVSEVVTFLKNIIMKAGTTFHNLILGNKELTGVVTSEMEYTDSDVLVATPGYVESQYLSKTHESEAQEQVGFLKGLWVKTKGLFGIDADGNARVKSLVADDSVITNMVTAVRGIIGALQSPNFQQGDLNGTGWRITDADENGQSKMEIDNLLVRMRFIANILEARRYVSLGGNYVYSPASSVVEQVDYYDDNGQLLGYDTIKVPFLVRMIPLLANTKLFSRNRMIKRSGTVDMADVVSFRCWIKADDGTTKTVNTWQVGMLARCQTMDVSETEGGTHTDSRTGAQGNRLYWREVMAKGQGRLPIDDGLVHSYVDLSNATGHFLSGSDAPLPGDSIVCYGATTAAYSNIIEIETIGADAPAFKEYRGVGLPAQGSTLPTFSILGKRKTMISPTTGNEFYAPRFVIETTNGDEVLYNMHRKGDAVALRTQVPARNEFHVDDLVMVNRNGVAKLYKKDLTVGGFWKEEVVEYGDVYHNLEDECLYAATPQGWQNQGTQIDVASFKLEVVGDAETAYAQKSGLNWTQTGEYVRSSTESISLLTETKNNGKNLFTGVLTGINWTDEYINTIDLDDDGWFCSKNNEIYSPYVTLVEGTTYTVSFEAESQINVGIFKVQQTETQVETILATRIGTTNRYKATFVAPYSTVMVSFSIDKIFEPQLELGSEATTFTAGADETASLVRQTASSIEAKVNETGINIEDKTVSIKASRFTVTNEAGTVNLIEGNADKNSITLTNTTVKGSFFNEADVSDGSYKLSLTSENGVPVIDYRVNSTPSGGEAKYFRAFISGSTTNKFATISAVSGKIVGGVDVPYNQASVQATHVYAGSDYGEVFIANDCVSTGMRDYWDATQGKWVLSGFGPNDKAGILLKDDENNIMRMSMQGSDGFELNLNNELKLTNDGFAYNSNTSWQTTQAGPTWMSLSGKKSIKVKSNAWLLFYGGVLVGVTNQDPSNNGWTLVLSLV